jgi:ribose 5-phosphate isomerase A
VVIADDAKQVALLGRFPLPVEVAVFGHQTTAARIASGLASCGIVTTPTLRVVDGEPVRTDGGNLIYDARCGAILDPPAVEAALKSITGVVDHGLFLDLAEMALIGTDAGVITRYR